MAAERDHKRHVKDPGRVRDLVKRIARGELSPVDLVRACLDRIDETQPHVAAWREVDGERALAVAGERAREAGAGRMRGPLHGIPVGIKDIIDVQGLPTRCNCRARENVAPASADAEVVLALKAAGAIVLGKVHTTEFAFFDPSPARNPHNTEHTPGGSSSGSLSSYNARSGLMLCCPITSKVKPYPFVVPILGDADVAGAALADQPRCLDWRARRAKRKGHVSERTLREVLGKAAALLS